ncbi:MAG: hypothetical protein D6732_13465 [Methanobacteriota archaeon]|nr:MAG: hypothetical protein D6732_13465 [Euryarchaeota archaeon]
MKSAMIPIDNENVGILGFGEVGSSLSRCYNSPRIFDLEGGRDDLSGIDVLNVCIPFKDSGFISTVKQAQEMYSPKLTIIHSTVAPGTTSAIGGATVHSPVRGVHPNLYEGIMTFVKYVGADSEEVGILACQHLQSLGIQTELILPSIETEVGKLFSTTQYGLYIAMHAELKKMCDEFGVNFETAVTHMNQTYNEGYEALGMAHVKRPLLTPPENGIGGHCIIPNAKILKSALKRSNEALELLLKYEVTENVKS